MHSFKKIMFYLFIILLLVSIYQDLTQNRSSETNKGHDVEIIENEAYSIAHVKVMPGDTVISIAEGLNKERLDQMNLKKIIEHFTELNPSTDPYNLKPYTLYYFPVYKN